MDYETQTTALVPVSHPSVTVAHPYDHALRVINELNAQPICRICERKFTLSPDRLDLCARCSA